MMYSSARSIEYQRYHRAYTEPQLVYGSALKSRVPAGDAVSGSNLLRPRNGGRRNGQSVIPLISAFVSREALVRACCAVRKAAVLNSADLRLLCFYFLEEHVFF